MNRLSYKLRQSEFILGSSNRLQKESGQEKKESGQGEKNPGRRKESGQAAAESGQAGSQLVFSVRHRKLGHQALICISVKVIFLETFHGSNPLGFDNFSLKNY